MDIPRLFRKTEAIILDEMHTLLDSERGVQVRSLLTRLELATAHRIRRIGLSATLGNMALAREYLRPVKADTVQEIIAKGGGSELLVQLRGYIAGDDDKDGMATTRQISEHLFANLRGADNLVFAGSRVSVEIYADCLRQLCEDATLPQEFYPHHASLAKDHREFVEERLKDDRLPTTAICTSTLELGIDIGDVKCVAQIGAPFSVAALIQRLGRSGRREGQPAILRQYAIETALESGSHVFDRLRLGLIRAIAMIELLLEKWCEAPRPNALHLSTLVHQILSVIAQHGGASAKRIYVTLCEKGPFSNVDQQTFLEVLRQLGTPDVELIEQSDDGILLLGRVGEKLVEHYSFYAVFMSPEEYRLVCEGKELGTIPVDNIVVPGEVLIFSGRRWEILEVHDTEKVIQVIPSKMGKPPKFGGDMGDIDDKVIEKMREIFLTDTVPSYLDQTATELLAEARKHFILLELANKRIVKLGDGHYLLATWRGTMRSRTLALAMREKGYAVEVHDGLVEVKNKDTAVDLISTLRSIADSDNTLIGFEDGNLSSEKFHPYLNRELLMKDAISSKLDFAALPELVSEIVV